MHTPPFDLSTAEAGTSLSSRPGQLGLHRETLFLKTKTNQPKKQTNKQKTFTSQQLVHFLKGGEKGFNNYSTKNYVIIANKLKISS